MNHVILGDFSKLKDDNYVYWNLVRHMLEAKQQEKAIELLTNLDWVTRKLNVCGPADIINDYIKVREQFPKGEVRDNYISMHAAGYLNSIFIVGRRLFLLTFSCTVP